MECRDGRKAMVARSWRVLLVFGYLDASTSQEAASSAVDGQEERKKGSYKVGPLKFPRPLYSAVFKMKHGAF